MMSAPNYFQHAISCSGHPNRLLRYPNREFYWGSPIENYPTPQHKFISVGLSNVTKLQCEGLNRTIQHTDTLKTAQRVCFQDTKSQPQLVVKWWEKASVLYLKVNRVKIGRYITFSSREEWQLNLQHKNHKRYHFEMTEHFVVLMLWSIQQSVRANSKL